MLPPYRGEPMCEKCVELDGRIDHYRLLASKITDPKTLVGIKDLIDGMRAQQTTLHSKEKCGALADKSLLTPDSLDE